MNYALEGILRNWEGSVIDSMGGVNLALRKSLSHSENAILGSITYQLIEIGAKNEPYHQETRNNPFSSSDGSRGQHPARKCSHSNHGKPCDRAANWHYRRSASRC